MDQGTQTKLKHNAKAARLISRRSFIMLCCGSFLSLSTAGYIYSQERFLKAAHYELSFPKLHQDLEGFKIAQVSDLHNAAYYFPALVQEVLDSLTQFKPRIIALSGDLIDKRSPHIASSISFIEKLSSIAPLYYVSGNHEEYLALKKPDLYADYLSALSKIEHLELIGFLKQDVLHGKQELPKIEHLEIKAKIDPLSKHRVRAREDDKKLERQDLDSKTQLCEERFSEERFKLLIAHRPELAERYAQEGFDLALCGHTHGGQIRLPFIGALWAPNQGFLPRYSKGLYQLNNAEHSLQMIVSSGLGCSLIPIRINNRPEISLITLHKEIRSN